MLKEGRRPTRATDIAIFAAPRSTPPTKKHR
jgi:hypothetical protein